MLFWTLYHLLSHVRESETKLLSVRKKKHSSLSVCTDTHQHEQHTHTFPIFLYQTWLEWQGHFPLAVWVALSFPGQPISPTPELIGNFDCPLSWGKTKRLFLLQFTYRSITSLPTISFLKHDVPPLPVQSWALSLLAHIFSGLTLTFCLEESIKVALAALMGRKFHFILVTCASCDTILPYCVLCWVITVILAIGPVSLKAYL